MKEIEILYIRVKSRYFFVFAFLGAANDMCMSCGKAQMCFTLALFSETYDRVCFAAL